MRKTYRQFTPEGYLSAKSVMKKFGCSRTTLYRIIADGAFTTAETIRFRGKRIFKEEAVNEYFQKFIEQSA